MTAENGRSLDFQSIRERWRVSHSCPLCILPDRELARDPFMIAPVPGAFWIQDRRRRAAG